MASVDTSLPAAYILGNTMSLLPALESTAYTTNYTGDPSEGGDIPYYGVVQWGKIAGDIRNQKDLIAVLEAIQDEAADEVIKKVGTIFVYKGQVATYEDLPENPTKGDTWNVIDTGANYVWNGEFWDKLSETVDLSKYVEKDELDDILTLYYNKLELDELINALTITLQTQINTKADAAELEKEIADREEAVENLITSINNVIQDINDNYCTKTYLTQQLDEVQDDLDAEIASREEAEQNIQTLINNVKAELQQEIADIETSAITEDEFDTVVDELQTNIDKVASDLQKHIDEAETGYVTNAEFERLENKVDAADAEIEDRLDAIEAKELVEYTDISTQETPNRKAIVLNNHDGIFGKDTDGNTRLLAMMSKYNVADFGAKDTHTNLNTKQIVTINDNQAILTDKNLDQIIKAGDNVVIDKKTVTDPTTGFEFQTFTINAELSGTDTRIDELADALDQEVEDRLAGDEALQAQIDSLIAKTESIFHYKGSVPTVNDLPNEAEIGDVYNVEETGSNYAYDGTKWDKLSETIDLTPYITTEEFNSKVWNTKANYFETKASTSKGTAMIWNESDGGGSKYEGIDGLWSYTGVNEGTAGKVKDTDGNTLTGRANEVMGQIYVYDSTNTISEKGNRGSWIDMTLDGFYYKKGANSNVTTDDELATIGNVKTVQNEFDDLSTTVDNAIAKQDGNIQSLLLQMDTLSKKIEDLKSLDYEIVELYDGSDPYYANEQKSFMLSGSVTTSTKVVGENITLDEATVYSSSVEFTSIQDITIKESTMQGTVYKAVSNAMVKLHADDYISVRDCQIIPETAYNGIEIGLTTGLAKSVIIDNVNFDGTFSNNGISIFGMDEGGVVTISNCYFKKVSNLIRLSNRTNTHWTINLINCVCDEWETGEYAGMILLQDYTSGSAAAADANNIFNKITINIQNCTKPDGTKIQPVEDLSTICGTKDNNQIIYMWDSWRLHTPYHVDRYPVINIL